MSFNNMEKIKVEQLKPYEKNAKKHDKKQIELIANSIKEFGFDSPIIVDKNNVIIAGHGRLEGAKLLGLDEVPVIRKENLTEEQVKAYRLADNKIAESEWDMGLAVDELKELSNEMFKLTGFDKSIFKEFEDSLVDKYTRKIVPPIYEPRGEKPSLDSLFDKEKTDKLLDKINNSSLSEDEKDFLRYSAYRMTIFNFENIADYYAHSSGEIKDLMEELALVIIDFNKAIELGFVKVSEELFNLEDNEE